MSHSRRADWYVPLGLVALALIPVAAGLVRLTVLAATRQCAASALETFRPS